MKIRKDVYNKLLWNLPIVPPETGGILGGQNGIIVSAYFDCGNDNIKEAIYVPNITLLNNVIEFWYRDNISFMGIFHSHIFGNPGLSNDDLVYISKVMENMPNDIQYLFFPIIIPRQKIFVYRVSKMMSVIMEKCDVI